MEPVSAPTSSPQAAPPAASPAPSAPPTDGAGPSSQPQQPRGVADAISEALDFGGSRQPKQAPAAPGQQQDPLAEILAGLPPDHPAHAHAQGLRANAGRWLAAQRQPQPAEPNETVAPSREQQIAEALLIQNVRENPARLHELAAYAGVEPEVLARAAGLDGQPGAPAAQGEPGRPRGLSRQNITRDFRMSVLSAFTKMADLNHEDSWTKGLLETRQQAEQLRVSAFDNLAEARLATDDPARREKYEKLAQADQARARELDLQSERERMRHSFRLMNALVTPLAEQLEEIIGLVESGREKKRAQAEHSAAYEGMLRSASIETEADGSARFGPAGYGIFDVDAAGNVTGTSEVGERVLDALPGFMAQQGFPMPTTVRQLEAALRLMYTFAPSDGQPAQQAASAEDGFTAQPQPWTQPAQGAGPSLPGNGAAGPRY